MTRYRTASVQWHLHLFDGTADVPHGISRHVLDKVVHVVDVAWLAVWLLAVVSVG